MPIPALNHSLMYVLRISLAIIHEATTEYEERRRSRELAKSLHAALESSPTQLL